MFAEMLHCNIINIFFARNVYNMEHTINISLPRNVIKVFEEFMRTIYIYVYHVQRTVSGRALKGHALI